MKRFVFGMLAGVLLGVLIGLLFRAEVRQSSQRGIASAQLRPPPYEQLAWGKVDVGGYEGRPWLWGTITNTSRRTWTTLAVEFVLLDSASNHIGTAVISTRHLGPGCTWSFGEFVQSKSHSVRIADLVGECN